MKAEEFNRLLGSISTNERSFRKIYEFYLPIIKLRVIGRFGKKADAEDVAHELFTKLIAMKNPPWVENPTAWIYRITDNIVLDMIKKDRSVPVGELPFARAEADGYPYITDGVAAESRFFSLLSLLPADDAAVVSLVIWEGYSLKEAAAMLHAGYGATRQKYSRALKKLAKALKDDKDKT